jgi:hypothetical protein
MYYLSWETSKEEAAWNREDNMKMDLQEMGHEGSELNCLSIGSCGGIL